jgi:hypothetical protein
LKENEDAVKNKAKLDKIIVFGLTSEKPLPTVKGETNVALKALLKEAFLKIKPDFDGEILYVSDHKIEGKKVLSVQCKLNSKEKALELRKECARFGKREEGCVFIANFVTATTRIRINILSKLAARLNAENIHSFCTRFEPRPMFRVNYDGTKPKFYTYVDAIRKFGGYLQEEDLQDAYARIKQIKEPLLKDTFMLHARTGKGKTPNQISTSSEQNTPLHEAGPPSSSSNGQRDFFSDPTPFQKSVESQEREHFSSSFNPTDFDPARGQNPPEGNVELTFSEICAKAHDHEVEDIEKNDQNMSRILIKYEQTSILPTVV